MSDKSEPVTNKPAKTNETETAKLVCQECDKSPTNTYLRRSRRFCLVLVNTAPKSPREITT